MAAPDVAPGAARTPGSAALPAPGSRAAGFRGALRSEFVKIRSTRSTYWTLLGMVLITVALGVLECYGAAHDFDTGGDFDPTNRSLDGIFLGQLVMAALGALTVTSEYSTGMVRTSLTAMPRRGVVFAAKAVAFAAVALATGLATSLGAFLLGQALLSDKHMNATLGQPYVLRAVIGGALFLTFCGLIAYGIGMVLRHTAGAITASCALLFVVPLLATVLPQSWQNDVNKWVPSYAGNQMFSTRPDPADPAMSHMFSFWGGFAVVAGYTALALIGGMIAFRARDA
ncbi:MAG TPA: ABC transporter permease [Actinocrinis sp.]|jgi:ABC-type transport system involved in multi-copper enzyme maturation permease subunit